MRLQPLALLSLAFFISSLAGTIPPAAMGKAAPAQANKPTPRPAALAEARTRLLHGNYEEAREAYEKAVKKDAALAVPAAIGIAETYRLVGDYDKASGILDAAKKETPGHPDLLAYRADLLYDLGRWDDAEKDANDAIAKSEGQLLARYTLARILRDRGKLDDADKAFRWVVRYYTKRSNDDNDIVDADELLAVAQCGAENARWHNISKQFSFILNEVIADALKNDKDFWPAELLAGQMLLEKYNRPDALDAFDKALKINPKAAEPLVGKGQAALVKYDIREAESYADQALKQNPKLTSALRLKADLLTMAGDYRGAENLLAIARSVNPRDAATLGRIAALHLLNNRAAQFDAIFKEVEGFDAKPGLFYHELATVLEERKQYARAEKYYTEAAALRPDLAGPRTALGMLQLRMGNETEARKLLDAAFKADPFNVRVSNSRKVLDHLEKYQTIQTAHYELRFDPKTDRVLAAFLADYLEETHAELKKQFSGYEPPGRILIEIFNSHEMFSGRTVGLPDLHTIGACTGKVVAMASPKARGVQRPFNWARVMRHELTHIFNLAQTDFLCPHWLTEGLAVQNEQMNRPPSWARILRERFLADDLLTLDTITLGFVRPRNPDEWTLAYAQSQLYVEYLVKTHGQDAVAKVLEGYKMGADTAAVLKKAIGVEKADFEVGYKKHVEAVVKAMQVGTATTPPEKAMTFEELNDALKKAPNDTAIKARLADIHFRRNQTAEAKKLADEVLAKDPKNTQAALVRVKLLLRGGDEEGAKTALILAKEANPDDPKLLLQVGRLHLQAKEYAEAAKAFEQGRKLAPVDGDWLEQLARVYEATKEPEKLIAVLREWVAQDPDELDSRLKLAQLLLDADRPADAEPIARDALYIDVNHTKARELLTTALKAQNKDADLAKFNKRYAE